MPLSSAEKMKRYRLKLKADKRDEEMKERHRNTVKKHRKKKNERISRLSAAERKKIAETEKAGVKDRVRKCRARQKAAAALANPVPGTSQSPPYKSRSSFGKDQARLRRALPKSPRKKAWAVRKLYECVSGTQLDGPIAGQSSLSALSNETTELVISFYQRDDVSRQAPGRKDVVTVWNPDKTKTKLQARHMFFSISEAHSFFKTEHPDHKIGKSKFAELRPKNVLLSNKLPHNVCCCKYHENYISAITALHKSVTTFPLYCKDFPELWLCEQAGEECWFGKCVSCINKFSEKIDELEDDLPLNCSWYVWKDIDGRFNKVVEEGTGEDLAAHVKQLHTNFMEHCYVKRCQAKSYQEERESVASESRCDTHALIQIDFSENYTCVSQDEIQSAHWQQSQVSLFTIAMWYDGTLKPIVLASDNITHSKDTVLAYIDATLELLPEHIKTVSIWSDGPASQFKNRYIAAALPSLQAKHALQISWNFFATSHGKGPVDGIGGALKRQVWAKVKQRQSIVTNAKQFVSAATQSNVRVIEVDNVAITLRNETLNTEDIFINAAPIVGIAKCHMFCARGSATEVFPLSRNAPAVSQASLATVDTPIAKNDWYAVFFNGKVYPGQVTCISQDLGYKVDVMEKVGCRYWKWPSPKDETFYSKNELLKKISAPVLVNSREHYEFLDKF